MTKQRLDAKGVSLIDTPTNGGERYGFYMGRIPPMIGVITPIMSIKRWE